MLWNKSYFYFCLWFHGERLWSWPFLHYFLGFQLKVQDLISAFMRVDAHGVQAFKWWNCTGKNPLHSSLAVMTRVECWMFQINRVFFYTVFPRSVNYWILFRPIAASGCHQKKKIVQLLLISGISRPSLSCFGFDLNQSPGTKPLSRNGYGPDWHLGQDSKNAGVSSFFFFVCGYQIVGHGPRRSYQWPWKLRMRSSWPLSLYANESRNEHGYWILVYFLSWLKWHIKLIMFGFWLFGNDVISPNRGPWFSCNYARVLKSKYPEEYSAGKFCFVVYWGVTFLRILLEIYG